MTTTLGDTATRAALTELPEQQCQRAFDRYQMLRPHRQGSDGARGRDTAQSRQDRALRGAVSDGGSRQL